MGLSGLAQVGLVAGGAAEGLRQGSEMRRREEEEKRRKEQYDFEKTERERTRAINEAAGRHLGQVGQQMPVDPRISGEEGGEAAPTRKYTEAEAYRDAAAETGRLGGDPLKAAQLRTTGMQLEQQTRQNEQQELTNRAMDIARRVHVGAISEAEGIRQLASLHGPIPDGRQASVTEINGQPHAVLTDENTRTSSVHPITGDGRTFGQAFQGFLALLDPASYNKERELGLRSRQVGAAERTAEAAGVTAEAHRAEAATHAQEAPARIAYYRGMGEYGRGNPGQIVQLEDAQGHAHPYSYNFRQNRFSELPLPTGLHFARSRQGIQPLQGNPGLFSDGERLFQMNDRTRQLEEVQTPQSLAEVRRLAAEGKARDQAQRGAGQGIQFPYIPSGERGGLRVPEAAAPGYVNQPIGLDPRRFGIDPSVDYSGTSGF